MANNDWLALPLSTRMPDGAIVCLRLKAITWLQETRLRSLHVLQALTQYLAPETQPLALPHARLVPWATLAITQPSCRNLACPGPTNRQQANPPV